MKLVTSLKAFTALVVSGSVLIGCNNTDRPHTGTTTTTSQAVVASDQELAKSVKDAISRRWFSKEYDQIQVSASNGIVTLQGPVRTWAEKESLDKEVRNMNGVLGLDSKVSVQEDASREKEYNLFPQDTYGNSVDQQLNRKIRDNVSEGWLWDNYKGVALNTSNGTVTLEGAVDSVESQQKLMQGIQKVAGVKMVKSNLRIEP